MTNSRLLVHLSLLISLFSGLNAQDHYWSKEFADDIINRYPNINDLTNKGWEYSNSIVLIGIEKLYYETGDQKYLNYIKSYIDRYVDSQGNISFDASANNLDHLHPGWLCITLYEELGQEKYKLAADKIRAEFDNQPRNPSGGFWHKERYPNQMWADGIYMAEPFLIRYGSVFDELETTADEATFQAILIADHAYDSTKNLLRHGWDETKAATWADPVTGVSPEVWSRGMGWYCMALVDILDFLPGTHANYHRMMEILQGLAQGIKDYQDPETGLWYQVVDKGDSANNWHETSGSAMFVYSLKKAIDNKYIDSATYYPVVEKGWEGLQSKISFTDSNSPVINDFVRGMGIQNDYAGYVNQEVVSTPFSPYPHGYCGVLLAASVMEFPLPVYYSLSVSVSGSGEVQLDPEQEEFIAGSSVTLTAVPSADWEFSAWEGSLSSTENPLNLTLDSNMVLEAIFEPLYDQVRVPGSEAMRVYPSPANDFVYFVLPEASSPEEWEIVSTSGSIVSRSAKSRLQDTGNGCYRLDITVLVPGMYYAVFRSGEELLKFSFMKN